MIFRKNLAVYIVGAGLCSTLLFLCFKKFDPSEVIMSESSRILKIFQRTRTVCVGRFLVDVPAEAQVVYGPAEVPYSVMSYRGSDMEKMIVEKLSELEKDRPHVYGALARPDSMVGKVEDGILPEQKIVFGISPSSFAFYNVSSYTQVGDDVFIQDAEASGAPQQYRKIVHELNLMSPLFFSRSDEQVPSEAGVCIENGFIRDAGRPIYEKVSIGVRLSSFPDIHLSILATNKDMLVASDALEPRVKQGEQLLKSEEQGAWYSQVKKLRQGQRKIGNWHGFEFLARTPVQELAGEFHEFAFLSQGQPGNPYLPVLDIELQSGVHNNKIGTVRPSVTDEEALMIWDRITSSIRVRPHH